MNSNLISIILSIVSIIVLIVLIILFIIERNGNKKDVKKEDNSGFIQFSGVVLEEMRKQNEKLADINTQNIKNSEENKRDLEKIMNDRFNIFKEDVNTNFYNINDKFDKKFEEINKKVDTKFEDVNNRVVDSLNTNFNKNNDSLIKVSEAVGKMTDATKNIDDLNKHVTSLNNVLNNSQSRGIFGEVQLESILNSVFGDTQGIYETQYTIPEYSDRRPDAVIFIENEEEKLILCIDSKFSFVEYEELFKKDSKNLDKSDLTKLKSELKGQIDKIAKDYIIKNVTYSYALMFIPNDSIYLFLQANSYLYENVIDYARKMNVIIVSPSTLQPILANVKALKINYELSKNIKDVIKNIESIKEESKRLETRFKSLSDTIKTLNNKKDDLGKTVEKIQNQSDKTISLALKKGVVEEKDLLIENKENSED